MVGFGIDGLLHRLDCTSSTTDDDNFLPFGVLAVKLGGMEDLSVEFLLAWQVRCFQVTTGSHSCPLLGSLTIQRPWLSFEFEVTRVSNFVRSSSPYRDHN
jgi:hypothetical protein